MDRTRYAEGSPALAAATRLLRTERPHYHLEGALRIHVERLEDLDDAQSLQAYALDHMGLPLDRWRAIEGEKFWKKKSDVAANVPETAVFNFVTNFIRRYRAGLPR